MITDSFDSQSAAIINPRILTFSNVIEALVLQNYDCREIASFHFATGTTPIYRIDYKEKAFAFYKTYVGAPACVGTVEDTLSVIRTDKYIIFGGAGRANLRVRSMMRDILTLRWSWRDMSRDFPNARKIRGALCRLWT